MKIGKVYGRDFSCALNAVLAQAKRKEISAVVTDEWRAETERLKVYTLAEILDFLKRRNWRAFGAKGWLALDKKFAVELVR